ncbi:MAG: hypothetical protein GY757_13130, partial [bacterium]|nr:hypothetical protein [bacterium]
MSVLQKAEDNLTYKLHLNTTQIYFDERALEEYEFGIDKFFTGRKKQRPPVEGKHTLDAEGTGKLSLPLKQLIAGHFLATLYLEVFTEKIDYGNEFFMVSNYFPADRAVGLRISKLNKTQTPIDVKFAAIDTTLKPAETRASISVYKAIPAINGKEKTWRLIKEYKNVTLKGKGSYKLEGQETGDYLLKCDAEDDNGDIISTSTAFRVGPYTGSLKGGLTIEALKTNTPNPKFINLSIRSHRKGTILLTVENKKGLDYFLIKQDTPCSEIQYPIQIRETYFPLITVNAIAIYENKTYDSNELWLEVPAPHKKLKIEIEPQAVTLPPSTRSKLTITVKDLQGKARKTRVLIAAVADLAQVQLVGIGVF